MPLACTYLHLHCGAPVPLMYVFSRMLPQVQIALLGWLSSVAGVFLALCSIQHVFLNHYPEPLLGTITREGGRDPTPHLSIYNPGSGFDCRYY